MDIEKMLGYGLMYLGVFFLISLVVSDVYKSRLRHESQIDINAKNHEENLEQTKALARALDENRNSMLDAIAALAMQKSLVLIASDDGNWKLVALDTDSKDKISEWLEQQRREVQAGSIQPERVPN